MGCILCRKSGTAEVALVMSGESKRKSRDDLEKQGWRLASTSSGTHLMRVVGMYRELGFEVHLETVTSQECGGCTECYTAGGEPITRIYTRRMQGDTMETGADNGG